MKQFKNLLVLVVLVVLASCSKPELEPNVCLNGDSSVEFWIDTDGHPGTYKDAQGVWHIKHAGLNYFTVKGKTAQLDPHYVINGVPLVTTSFDSNFFYTLGNVIWTYPVYSYHGLYSSSQMNTPIPYGTATYTFPQLIHQVTIENLAGYEIQHNPAADVYSPPYEGYFGTYSNYTYLPQQQMVFFNDFEGMEATIYIEVCYGEDKVVVDTALKIKFEH